MRFHGLLSDDLGTFTVQNKKPLYSFFNADQIFDFLLSIGVKPFVELGFMPEALASGHKTVFHYRGNVTPPNDYKKWAALIRKLVRHWVDRYGIGEVREWFFEVWNEPNLKAFWTKGQDEYFKLYRVTVEAIKDVDASLRVGGPATAKNEWIEEFVAFCAKKKLPADFISTHHYPTDALGQEGDDTLTQLAQSRRSILREQAQDTFRRAQGKPDYYTEWNASSNPRDPLHDQPYAAAFLVKTILEMNGLVEGYSFWTSRDSQAGLSRLRVTPPARHEATAGGRNSPGRRCLGRSSAEKLTVMLTNHALPRHAIAIEQVRVRLSDAEKPRAVSVERIDDNHANPRRVWHAMKEPNYLTPAQVERLQEASRTAPGPQPWKYKEGVLEMEIKLPPQSVAAITVEFAGKQ